MSEGRFVSDAIAQLKAYEPGKPIEEVEREFGVKDALKLASNENVWGPSPRALDAARDALGKLWLYPDAASFALRQDLAASLGVTKAEVVVGNGSNEIIGMLVRCFVQDGQSVASSAGSFIAYKIAARSHGRRYVESPLGSDFGYDLDALLAVIDETTRLVFIANPNNPTGTLIGRDALAAFIEALDKKSWGPAGPPMVVLDEAYVEFVDRGERPDAPDSLAIFKTRPRVVLLRTFSKAYGLAGLRVGYAVCEPNIADYLNRVRDPFNLNVVGQAAARAALADTRWTDRVVKAAVASRAALSDGLGGLGLAVVPSQANFVLAGLGTDAKRVNDGLMRHAVIARPVGQAGLPNHLRVTVGRDEDNAKLISALRAVLGT